MMSFAHALRLKRLYIDTYKKAVIYMRKGCQVCRSEGFEAESRIRVGLDSKSIIATLNMVDSDILESAEAGLSEYAWNMLGARENDMVTLSHPKPLTSLSYVRSKVYGHTLSKHELTEIISDITQGFYSDVHISAFLASCAHQGMSVREIIDLTRAMVNSGQTLNWSTHMVVDKHCVGGLPGNRTTPIVVSIVAAFGLTMPKTSSRAITSPAGTADAMEVLAPVEMGIDTIQKVVNQEKGCIVWGGNIALSPADDILIRVEKALDLDSEGQLVASVLSKKIAAGSTHVLIDIPIGKTAKVRSKRQAILLKSALIEVGRALGVTVEVLFTDGSQPIGRGIGPSLEARDILQVLQQKDSAPMDLREKSLLLAGKVIEFDPKVKKGEGLAIATDILNSGKAWKKFQTICDLQGGLRTVPEATYSNVVRSQKTGRVTAIHNRNIALVAKLAGAPMDKTAGVDLHVCLGSFVKKDDALFVVQASSAGGLQYAMHFIQEGRELMRIEQ